MIGRVIGFLILWGEGISLIRCGGGPCYEVLTSFVPKADADGDVDVWTHAHYIEGAPTLYGFATKLERDLFRRLIDISGVGPRSAFSLLGAMDVSEVFAAIDHANIKRLCEIPGIGRKTAENIIKALQT